MCVTKSLPGDHEVVKSVPDRYGNCTFLIDPHTNFGFLGTKFVDLTYFDEIKSDVMSVSI